MGQLSMELLFTSGGPLYPFGIAAALLLAVLVLEVIMSITTGFSILGGDSDADIDLDPEIDVNVADVEGDIRIAFDMGGADADANVADVGDVSALESVLKWFEIGSVPLMVWLIGFAASFSIVGFLGQFVLQSLLGFMLFGWIASAAAFVPALIGTKWISRAFASLIPKTTTDIISRRSLGGSVGKIAIGTARVDLPARADVRDRHGNLHNIRVIPYAGEPELPQGTDVLVLRGPGPVYEALRLDTAQSRLQS